MILLFFYEGILTYAADGADPILREIFKCGSGRDAAVGIANLRVVYVAAWFANVSFHDEYLLIFFFFIISCFAGKSRNL